MCFLNYKADGTPFWNQFFVAPLRDDKNRIVNYVGAQCLVPGPLPAERPTPTAKPPESIRGGKGSRTGGDRSSEGRGAGSREGARGGGGRSSSSSGGDGGTGNSSSGSSGKGDGSGRGTAASKALGEDEGRTKGGEELSGERVVKEEGHATLDESLQTAVTGRKEGGIEDGGEEDLKEGEWNSCLAAADAAENAATSVSGFGGDDDVDMMNLENMSSVNAAADGDVTGAMLQTDGLVTL